MRAPAWLATPRAVVALFVVGIAIRFLFVGMDGHSYDLGAFVAWADGMVERGPSDFYTEPGETTFYRDYPPGYLYVLWGLGALARAAGRDTVSIFVLKLVGIAADIVLAWTVMRLAERLTPTEVAERGVPAGLLGAAAILLNPAMIFLSSVWGQVDSVLGLLVVGAFLLLGTKSPTFGREAMGVALLAMAVATKPQAAFVAPAVALVLGWRHVHLRSGVGSPKGLVAMAGLARLVALGMVGTAVGMLLFAPFGLGLSSGFDLYARTADAWKWTSLNAFNLWGAFGMYRPDIGDGAVRVLGLPAFYCGLLLFSVGTVLLIARGWASLQEDVPEGRVLVFSGAALTLLAFVTLTRMHDRYLFLPLALWAAFVAFRKLRWPFIALSAMFFASVLYPYIQHFASAGRPAPGWGGVVRALLGTDGGDVRLRIASAVTAAVALIAMSNGWSALSVVARPTRPVGQHVP